MRKATTHSSRRALLQKGSLGAALLAAPLFTHSSVSNADADTISPLVGVWDLQANLQSDLLSSALPLPDQAKLINAELTFFADGNLAAVSEIDEIPPFRGPTVMGHWTASSNSQFSWDARRRVLSVAGIAAGVMDVQGTGTLDSSGNTFTGSCTLKFTLLSLTLPVTITYALQGTRQTVS